MGAILAEDKVFIDDEPTITRLDQKGFGKRIQGKLELSLLEALFLLERESIKVLEKGRECAPQDLLRRVDEEEFLLRYGVYKDLRERGYIVKTGFKFGAHFRVYERGESIKEHSRYLVHAVKENSVIAFPELSRAVRLAHGVKKTIIFAVVDDEGDITYYNVERITP
jgi:tRNA-intron endonuclease